MRVILCFARMFQAICSFLACWGLAPKGCPKRFLRFLLVGAWCEMDVLSDLRVFVCWGLIWDGCPKRFACFLLVGVVFEMDIASDLLVSALLGLGFRWMSHAIC